MSGTEMVPDWLRKLLAESDRPTPRSPQASGGIRPGQIRVAQGMDGQGPGRLALIIESFEDPFPWVNALLVSPLTEVATYRDVLLTAEETGLPFAALVETDMPGPLFQVQLGDDLGEVRADVLLELLAAADGEDRPILLERGGTPLLGRTDPRWPWKETEVDVMQQLGSSVLRQQFLTEEDPSLAAAIVDPGVFDRLESGLTSQGGAFVDVEDLLLIAALAETSRLEIPQEAVFREGNLRSWVTDLSPDDRMRALGPLLEQALASPVPPTRAPSVRWQGAASSSLDARIAARASRGVHAVAIVAADPDVRAGVGGDTVCAEVDGFGRVQVSRRSVRAGKEAA